MGGTVIEIPWMVSIGGADVSPDVRMVRRRHEDEDQTRNPTTIVLSRRALSGSIDYLGEVRVEVRRDSVHSEPFFAGEVKTVNLGATSLILNCLSGLNVSDHRAGFLQYQRCGVDVIYSLMRTAGYHDDEMDFGGLEDLPHERFAVALPLEGVRPVSTSVRLPGPVNVVSRDEAIEVLNPDHAPLDPNNSSGFLSVSDTFILARVWSFTAYDAETESLRRIDDAIAYLTIASRYSNASLPSGLAASYDRSNLIFSCKRSNLLALRGESTGRAWLRETPAGLRSSELSLDEPPLEYVHQDALHGVRGDRTSLLVRLAARAAVLTEPVDRVTTLWQAIEFYAASTSLPELFDRDAVRAIKYALRRHVRKKIGHEQNARLDQVLADLNNPPLMAKLREQLQRDGIPVSHVEMSLLARLRDFRNRSNHGRGTGRLSRADVDRGVAIAARIALHLLYRSATET